MSRVVDQAEGLRRLIGRQSLRIMLFASGGRRAGKTTVALNVAIAAVQRGRTVLLLDENRANAGVASLCGLAPRGDLHDAMCGRRALDDILVAGPEGLLLLPAARAVREQVPAECSDRSALAADFERLAGSIDWLVIDTAPGFDTRLLPLALSAQDFILVLSEDAEMLTQSYKLIKLARVELGITRFSVLGARCMREDRLREQCARLASAVRRYLDASVDYLGAVPFDPYVRRAAALARPLVQAFPSAPATARLLAVSEKLLKVQGSSQPESPAGAFLQRLIEGSRLDLACTLT